MSQEPFNFYVLTVAILISSAWLIPLWVWPEKPTKFFNKLFGYFESSINEKGVGK